MVKNKLLSVIAISVVFMSGAYGQQALPASGGTLSSSYGVVAVSIGQMSYAYTKDSSYQVSEGVQQTYIVSEVLGSQISDLEIALIAFPNPTKDILTLKINSGDYSTMTYELIDSHGKLIETSALLNGATAIAMTNLVASVYILKVIQGNTLIKTFRIIKSQ